MVRWWFPLSWSIQGTFWLFVGAVLVDAIPFSQSPTDSPADSSSPSSAPSGMPSASPSSLSPTESPMESVVSSLPSMSPLSLSPSLSPTASPTLNPSIDETTIPTSSPSLTMTLIPTTLLITAEPTVPQPTSAPTRSPSATPTRPSMSPTTSKPSQSPSLRPTHSSAPTRWPTRAGELPNVLILLTDDLDYSQVDYNGGLAYTPNITALAFSPHGILLDRLYSPSAVCSPSRLALLSGRVPERDCVAGPLLNDQGFPYRPNVTSIVFDAQRAGYQTAFFGKWHLSNNPGYLGYDFWVSSTSSVPTYDPACFCMERSCMDSCKFSKTMCFKSAFKHCSARSTMSTCDMGYMRKTSQLGFTNWVCQMTTGGPPGSPISKVQFPRYTTACAYLAQRFSEYADANLKDSVRPFFVQVSFQEPHRPFIASPDYRRQCYSGRVCRNITAPNSILTNYFGVVASIDTAVGAIIDKLRSVNRLNNTLVVFTSDNAGEASANGGISDLVRRPFRGTKRLVYEGGIRVPGLIYWEGMIKKNAIVYEPTILEDFAPTFHDILAEKLDGFYLNYKHDLYDGESWLPMIRDPKAWRRSGPVGTCQPLSYLMSAVCLRYAYMVGSYKIIATRGTAKNMEIYDIPKDPRELNNLVWNRTLVNELFPPATAWVNSVYMENKAHCPAAKLRLH